MPEAKAIAAWIVENFASFYDLYHRQQEEPDKKVDAAALIGVVTPFRAQADVISDEIRKAASNADPSADLPTNLAQKITVGTAHRLQGAERPIILFSAVYGGGSPQAGFIDKKPELMNVAVSRAKDLLVVFAAPIRWDNGKIFSVMSRHAQRAELIAMGAEVSDAVELTTGDEQTSAGVQGNEQVADPAESEAAAPSDLASPAVATDATVAAAGAQGTLTAMLRSWSEVGELRGDDADLKAPAFNLRLAEAGVLEGRPGAWEPTRLAALVGVLEVERTNPDGVVYTSLEYTPLMQELLLQLYRDGSL